MLSRLRFALFLPLVALTSCASSAPISAASPTPTGDYAFSISPAGVTPLNFSGNLNIAGTSVSGVFRYNNPAANCVSSTQDIAFSGLIVNAVLTLTSGTFSNSTATITIPLPLTSTTSGSQIAHGTAVISGGTCAVASSPLQITYIPSFGQTYSGSLTGPVDGTLALAVTESAANPDGQFPAVAVISFGGAGCNFTLTGITGIVSGYTINLGNGTTAPNNEVAVIANASTSPINVTMNVFNNLPTCQAGQYSGTIQ
jgi:hypothetical protein